MTRVALLGSTGSIGEQCLDLVEHLPEHLEVVALAAGRNIERLAEQAKRFRPEVVACADPADVEALRRAIGDDRIAVLAGEDGQRAVGGHSDAEVTVAAVVGFAGLVGTLAAAQAGKRIALANKESLVAAGQLICATARRCGAELVPVDSEHAALHQCLAGERAESVARLWLTASGGPFRGLERTDLAAVTLAEALDHPNWSMGAKVTIDSATLMNKGLELIEACHLFDLPPERVEIVVHPPSIVHSMVEFIDGTWKAQLGAPDMRPPIAYALTAPERLPLVDAGVCRTWSPLGEKLEFEAYDRSLFVAPDLCRAALAIGGGAAAALNGLNEALVARYLGGEGSFLAISDALTDGLEAIRKAQLPAGDLAQIRAADQLGRALAS